MNKAHPCTRSRKKKPQLHEWLRLALLVFLVSTTFHAHGQTSGSGTAPPEIGPLLYLAPSGRATLDNTIRELLQEQLGKNVIIRSFKAGQTGQDSGTPVVTIGSDALSQIRQENHKVPVVSLLAKPALLDSWASRSGSNVPGVYQGAPLLHQALAGKIILPHATRVAMLASPDSAVLYEDVPGRLAEYGMEGRIFLVSNRDDLINTLKRALQYGDFLLAAPDPDIYNPRTIKHILLTAYRRNRIVIGPTQDYVSAGSMAAVYTPLDAMAEKAADYLEMLFKGEKLPPPNYGDRFAIRVNRQVAQSLNIPVPANHKIIEDLRKLTGHSGELRHD